MMLKRSIKNNINLIEEMQKPQLICLKMPERMFSTMQEKSIYTTYWMTKIWLALQLRDEKYKKLTSVNIVIDELSQVPFCEEFVRSKLSQIAKFHAKIILSAHYLGQLKIIGQELKSANSSFILIQGSHKDNFNSLKHELAPYEVEDLLSLKQYHALCLLRTPEGYARFVVKLPPKILGD